MITSFCWLSGSAMPPAHKWTLEECVDYALRHSPEVRMLNTYTNTSTGQTSVSLTGKMNLFDGFCSRYKKRMARDLVLVEEHNLADTKMTLIMNVVEAYLQVLMDMQLLEISERQVAIDSLQTLRLQGLLKHGKISYVDVVQQHATLQSSMANVSEKKNQLSTDKLSLFQLMDLELPKDF